MKRLTALMLLMILLVTVGLVWASGIMTEKSIAITRLQTTGWTTVYTLPASTTAILKSILVTNTSTTDVTIDLVLVASGEAPTSSPSILPTRIIPANEMANTPVYIPLSISGYTIQAKPSVTSSLSVIIGGAEVDQ